MKFCRFRDGRACQEACLDACVYRSYLTCCRGFIFSRYRRNEKFTWHLDALGPTELDEKKGGQRTATLLVYHTDLDEEEGGATIFRDLRDKNGERLRV